MGNGSGKGSLSPEFLSSSKRFSEAELRDIKKLFISLAYQSRSHGEFVIASVFQVHNWKQSIPPCCFWSIAVGFEVKFYLVEY
jgi:hypothetical protein